MKYPLQDLLNVRRFREDEAQGAVTAARARLQEAEDSVRQAEDALEQYIAFRQRREQELYDDIMLQEVSMKDLDDLKAAIASLREQQGQYEEQIRRAKSQVAAAQEALAAAQQAWTQTVRNREKIDEHRQVWEQEDGKRREAEAEKEMEDFRVRGRND